MANLVDSKKTTPEPVKGFGVLVVDGDSGCLAMLSTILWTLGYKVLTAKGGFEALYIAKKEDELHLVLTEAHLPDMKKYELLEKLKEVSDLPVVIMSDDDDRDGKLNFLIKGAAFYIVKPLSMDTLDNLWQYAFYNNKTIIDTKNAHVELQGMSMNYKRERMRASSSASSQPRTSSSTFNFQGEVHQLPNLYSTSTLYQPEHRSHFLEDFNSQMATTPAFGYANRPIHVNSSSNEILNEKYGPSTHSNQLDYTYFNAEHIGPESSSNMDLAAGFGHEGFFREDLNSQIPTRPAFGSADIPIHVDSSSNEASIYGQSSHRNMLDYNCCNAEQIGPESSNNIDLAASFGHVNESLFRANIFQDQNKNSSIVHDFGHQSVTGCPIIHDSIQQNEQQHEEHNSSGEFDAHILLSPLLASQDQEHDTLGFDRESDDFFKFAEEDTGKVFDDVEEDNVQCFDDVDSDDFF